MTLILAIIPVLLLIILMAFFKMPGDKSSIISLVVTMLIALFGFTFSVDNLFDIAVRMYPTDQVANLNAAAVALSQKDLNTAVKYMEKADHTTAEFMNNTGVYNFLNGDIQRAMAAFEQAAKLGNEAAQANLKQLQQILNVKMK